MSDFIYYSLSQDERDLMLAEMIHAREVERYHYALNAANYAELLSNSELIDLPDEWPEEVKHHKNKNRDELAATVHPKDHKLVFNLQLRDRLRHLLATETIELQRVEKYHAQAIAKLPEERRIKAFAAAHLKREKS